MAKLKNLGYIILKNYALVIELLIHQVILKQMINFTELCEEFNGLRLFPVQMVCLTYLNLVGWYTKLLLLFFTFIEHFNYLYHKADFSNQ